MAIFYVEGNDAQTIAAAASIENAAEQRARAEADKTGGKPTMTFFASAQEAAVVIAADDLRAQYKEEFGLAKRPILLPYGSPLMPYQGQHNQGETEPSTATSVASLAAECRMSNSPKSCCPACGSSAAVRLSTCGSTPVSAV